LLLQAQRSLWMKDTSTALLQIHNAYGHLQNAKPNYHYYRARAMKDAEDAAAILRAGAPDANLNAQQYLTHAINQIYDAITPQLQNQTDLNYATHPTIPMQPNQALLKLAAPDHIQTAADQINLGNAAAASRMAKKDIEVGNLNDVSFRCTRNAIDSLMKISQPNPHVQLAIQKLQTASQLLALHDVGQYPLPPAGLQELQSSYSSQHAEAMQLITDGLRQIALAEDIF